MSAHEPREVLNECVTLLDVYEYAINPDLLAQRIVAADRELARVDAILVDQHTDPIGGDPGGD